MVLMKLTEVTPRPDRPMSRLFIFAFVPMVPVHSPRDQSEKAHPSNPLYGGEG